MDIIDAIRSRHSVRHYTDKNIEPEKLEKILFLVKEYNQESGLHIQLVTDEPRSFGESLLARYGKFSGVKNYFAMIGKKSDKLDELVGYYGEKLVLEAQMMGLNTCWVALTHGKSKAIIENGEKEVILISLGYGKTQGTQRKSKTAQDVSNLSFDSPDWFKKGMEAALLAPTAINQQKFKVTVTGNKVCLEAGRIGPCLKIDLGIVKCHFELGAGKENFEWE